MSEKGKPLPFDENNKANWKSKYVSLFPEQDQSLPDPKGTNSEIQALEFKKSVDDIKKECEINEIQRGEQFKGHFEIIALFFLWSAFVSIIIILLVLFWHLITPETINSHKVHWLKPEQEKEMKGLVTGAFLIALLTDHYKKRLKD